MNAIDAIRRPAVYAAHPDWHEVLRAARERVAGHGDTGRWQTALDALPALTGTATLADAAQIKAEAEAADAPPDSAQLKTLEAALRDLHPWRKGPFDLFGIHIDAEWHSDWKWDRIAAALGDLDGQQVLDVGCGNGYFGWRLLGAGASGVLGVDPTVLFFLQHLAICRYLGTAVPNPNPAQSANFLLPIPFELLPAHPFDLVLSMGVVYHRPDPAAHVRALFDNLRPGGRVLLESLIVTEGPDLTPATTGQVGGRRGRYARMRNVHVLPTLPTLTGWLEDSGFTEITTVDVSPTTTAEQRATDWMTFESLDHCLDPADSAKTVEGYPAPVRAALLARRPG